MNIPISFNWKNYSIFEQINYLFRRNKTKIFSYDFCGIGENFVLEADLNTRSYYMTSLQAGAQLGDCVQIHHLDKTTTYQIQEIEYYTEPSDMWMARLLQIEPT